MDVATASRHKTLKRSTEHANNDILDEKPDAFRTLLEDSAREAYSRPWHRLERGLRLNRLRMFIEDISLVYGLTKDEKEGLFLYLQKALDKRLLNTHKIVQYDQETQKIVGIKNLELKRNPEGIIRWGFSTKKPRTDMTRKKKKTDGDAVVAGQKIEEVST